MPMPRILNAKKPGTKLIIVGAHELVADKLVKQGFDPDPHFDTSTAIGESKLTPINTPTNPPISLFIMV